MIEQRDPFAQPPDEEPTILGPLAERDPNAPLEESAEYVVTGATSFDEVLRRARRQGFVAGAAAGGVAGAVVAVLLAIATARPGSPQSGSPTQVAVLERATPEPAFAPPSALAPGRRARAAVPSSTPPATREAARAPPRSDLASLDAGAAAVRSDAAAPAEPAAHPADPPSPEPGPDRPGAPAAIAEAAARPASVEPASAARPPRERDVTAALAARREDLEACVAETPGDGAAARGRRFRMLVVVEPGGQVSEARAYDDAIAVTPLGVCLARLAKEATFPPFDGEPAHVEVKVRADE